MNFHNASFKAAYGTSEQLPASTGPEVSFAGRSNVGKSSLLNKLMYRKGLAKVSSTPGKTATINFYDVDGHDLVDLPGYGYAKVSKAEKGRWSELIEGYYNQDRDFALVVSLIDIRHEPSALDRNMVQFLMDAELPFAIALTKADKLSKQQQMKQRAAIKKALKLPGGVPMVVTSSEKGDGIDELRALRREALLAEMRHVEAQAECWLEEHPDEAARIAAEHRRTQATPEMLLGTAVVNGDSPAFGFTPETYLIAPSLRVYELFMWYDENERWTRN